MSILSLSLGGPVIRQSRTNWTLAAEIEPRSLTWSIDAMLKVWMWSWMWSWTTWLVVELDPQPVGLEPLSTRKTRYNEMHVISDSLVSEMSAAQCIWCNSLFRITPEFRSRPSTFTSPIVKSSTITTWTKFETAVFWVWTTWTMAMNMSKTKCQAIWMTSSTLEWKDSELTLQSICGQEIWRWFR